MGDDDKIGLVPATSVAVLFLPARTEQCDVNTVPAPVTCSRLPFLIASQGRLHGHIKAIFYPEILHHTHGLPLLCRSKKPFPMFASQVTPFSYRGSVHLR